MRELMVPTDAKSAVQAVELLRGWIIDGQPQYVLFPDVWNDDVASWGRFLADTANHIADAIARDTGRDRQEVFGQIVESFLRAFAEDRPREGEFHARSDREN